MTIVNFPPPKPQRPTVRDILGPGGIAREVREPQLRYAELVAQAIEERRNAILEAGTGTGKSLGYLVPAILGGHRVVISTATKALQSQLESKDLPTLRAQLAPRGVEFTYAVLKGASNYACVRKVDEQMGLMPQELEDWVTSRRIADLDGAPGTFDGRWLRAIATDTEDCGRKKCPFWNECHYRRAREDAEAVQVLVVNHAVLALSAANPFLLSLSDFKAAIIDEAHAWEDVAREAFGGKITPAMTKKFYAAVEEEIGGDDRPAWDDLKRRFRGAMGDMLNMKVAVRDEGLLSLMDRNMQATDVLLPVQHARDAAAPAGEILSEMALWLRPHLMVEDVPEHAKIARMLENIASYFSAVKAGDVISVARRKIKDDEKYPVVTLETFPLNVGPRLKEPLYDVLPVIYTSATISAGGSFDMPLNALGLDRATTLTCEIGSPFDYQKNALLYIPKDMPLTSDGAYVDKLCRQMLNLVRISEGRAFLLFTSYGMMDKVYDRLGPHLGFPRRKQNRETPKQALIDWFVETPGAVLFATASFWEGVSIEGDDLSLVAMDKLPFPVPSDPIYQAKETQLVARGLKGFNALMLPYAIVRLKQGFGRLIRNTTDRGIVAILDSRLVGKGYGQQVIKALPPARLVTAIDIPLFASYVQPPDPNADPSDLLAFS